VSPTVPPSPDPGHPPVNGSAPAAEPVAIPAATVVLLREGDGGVETLLLRRSSRLAFAGGHWVFPGGRVDPGDREPGAVAPAFAAARRAAVREAAEETGLAVAGDELVWFAHWTAPPGAARRFAAWFFAAPAPTGAVAVDGGEIEDHVWVAPAEALARRDAGTVELSPPTWVTLWHLRDHPTVAAALGALRARPPRWYASRLVPVDGGTVALWAGDAGYDDHDPTRPGPRHRLTMGPGPWRYESDGADLP
jgi:8-oxo-dGTP pyrophosphatase MutT (NUDIX family)